MIYHEIHHHYHFEDFADYELYRVTSGRLRSDLRQGLLLRFRRPQLAPRPPGRSAQPRLQLRKLRTDSGIHGISVGWADIYGAGVPGQEFDVTGTAPRAILPGCENRSDEPAHELLPGGEDNNVQTVQIHMNTKRASQFSTPVPI